MSTQDQYETKWKSTQQGRVIFYMHSVLSEKGCVSDAFLCARLIDICDK